jgi:crotonobetainyl-CoA:carnitine CoA-transferase CaiB-like acyl-CoA transferase
VPNEGRGPLQGVKVVEFGNLIAGPYCAMLLADLGADVIKIEPRSGDLSRAFGPYVGAQSYYFVAINRGKRSVVVNPRHEASRDWVRKLCLEADVVVHNLRFGAMERMGLGYEDLVDDNPRLVYAEVSAFGSTGPMAQRPGIDNIFQGESGMMSLTGAEGDGPAKTATTVGDYLAGTNAALSISAALAGRAATGKGTRVDVSLRDGLIAIQSTWNAMYFADGQQPGRIGTGSWFTAPTDTFATSDGHLNIAIVSDRHFELLCEEVGLEIADEDRYGSNALRVDHRGELRDLFAPIFASATTDEWIERLDAKGLPVGRLMTLPEVFDDPQVRHNEMRVVLGDGDAAAPVTGSPLRLGGTPAIAGSAAPGLGVDTNAVLSDLGASEDQIADLIAQGLAFQG